jgi:hypothetical protein
MGSRACGTCGLSVPTSWESRHQAAGCAARLGLVKDSQFNAARILLGDYTAAGPRSRRELEEYLLAHFPPGDGWEATPSVVEQVVSGFMKFWHLENEENTNMMDNAKTDKNVKYVCRECGSGQILHDAWAVWSEDIQAYELSTVLDFTFCEQCDGETRTEEIEVLKGNTNMDAQDQAVTAQQAAFWEVMFAQEDSLRIGLYRIVNVNGGWAALEDGANPQLEHVQFPTLQAAVDYCIRADSLYTLTVSGDLADYYDARLNSEDGAGPPDEGTWDTLDREYRQTISRSVAKALDGYMEDRFVAFDWGIAQA